MTAYDDLYGDLKRHVDNLELILLDTISINDTPSSTEEIEREKVFISAYCLLVHAGIEEFVEQIATKLLEETVQKWNSQQKANKITALLLGEKRDQLTSKKREKLLSDDYLTGLLNQAKKAVQQDISSNNGIKLVDLYRLFGPLGIEIDDLRLSPSLDDLAKLRGAMAHTVRTATNLRPPSDYKALVTDCLQLCDNIRDQANRLSEL
jgi:hypothetical protein